MRVLLAIAAIAVSGACFASPEEPGKQKTGSNPKTSATQEKQSTNVVSPVFEINIGKQDQPHAEKTESHSAEKFAIDRDIRDFTGQLANYTLWLACATIVLGVIGAVQGVFLWKTVDLARSEFLATHRPKLLIRKTLFKNIVENGQERLAIAYEVVNTGDTVATINRISTRVIEQDAELDPEIMPDYADSVAKNIEVAPGYVQLTDPISGEQATEIGFVQGYAQTQASANGIVSVGAYFHFFGFIEYKDELGRFRRTGFLRKCNASSENFVVVANPEYEYQD